jgi:LmbE family N-acetylglucosaminyl deacetylase
MLRSGRVLLSTAAALAVAATVSIAPARRLGALEPRAGRLSIASETRLLVVAPHPDDEIIGAAGLMQRVHASGGVVRVVYLTDGEGFKEGVSIQDRVQKPKPVQYREYGRERRIEARRVLESIGLDSDAATFLGFPDSGLCLLLTRYWSDHRAPFRSPFSRLNRPPKSEIVLPDTEYRGEDLTDELAIIVGEFRPTLILVTRPEDQHPDHCAAWYFLNDALHDVRRVIPGFSPDVLTYIVHYYDWPFQDDGPALPAPPDLPAGVSGWIRFTLSAREARAKRTALAGYKTQMHAMSWFLNAFARRNEIFARLPVEPAVLPLKRNPCCE